MTGIQSMLFAMQDAPYAAFQRKLLPTVPPETVIGVRTIALRKLAKQLAGSPQAEAFLTALPHSYFDENQLHAFLIGETRDFDSCVSQVDSFLPYVDNWATCDQLSPKAFKKNTEKLRPHIERWLCSAKTYTVRFGVGMLLSHFLDDSFDPADLTRVAAIVSDEYYIQMMQAWYFATALAKQPGAALPFLEDRRLPYPVHNKTIQKAIESDRIAPAQKAYLRTLREKKKGERADPC